MQQPIPDWINNEFISQCLQNEDGKQNVVVTNLSISQAVPPGNNYGSCIVRVKVEYKSSENDCDINYLSLVIKSELTEGPVKEAYGTILLTEPAFYYEFLPEARKLTDTSFVPKNSFSPKPSVIVFEDLKEQGFVMADRVKQLDYEHCLMYVNASATLHAVSFAVHKQNPKALESIRKEKMFSNELKTKEVFKNMIDWGSEALCDVIVNEPGLKKYFSIIKDSSKDLWDLVVEAHKPCVGINTINQGDPWTTNMMFKYDDNGKVEQIKLLDFQVTRVASPVNDLVFFIWASANHDVRKNKLGDLYQTYHHIFNNKLKEFNCSEVLTFDDFMKNIEILSPLALLISVIMNPIMCQPEPVNMEDFFTKEDKNVGNPFIKYYNEDFLINHLPKLLKELEMAGVFEYMKKLN